MIGKRNQKINLQFCIVAVLVACIGCTTTSSDDSTGAFPYVDAASVGIEDSLLTSLAEQVSSWVDEGQTVGSEVLIIKDGNTILHEAFGWKDRERGIPMERNTIFRIRSMTKPVVGTAILMLAAEQSLSLDDQVSGYLPSFQNELSSAITIRQLLHHSGGFSDPGFPMDLAEYESLRDAVDALGENGPENEPGAEFIYSDGGSATLGAIVAEVTGNPVESFINHRILTPLTMDNTLTTLSMEDSRRTQVSSTYEIQEEGGEFVKYWENTDPQRVSFFRASGGLYATPMDYAKFLSMWMDCYGTDGCDLITRELVQEALSPGKIPQYGLHWNLLWKDSDEDDEGSDSTLSGFGHIGSDGTIAFAFPHEGVIFCYFSQSRGGNTPLEFLGLIRNSLINNP